MTLGTQELYAVEWTCRHCGHHCVSTGQLAQKPAQKLKPVRMRVECANCQQPRPLFFHEVVLEDTVKTRGRESSQGEGGGPGGSPSSAAS